MKFLLLLSMGLVALQSAVNSKILASANSVSAVLFTQAEGSKASPLSTERRLKSEKELRQAAEDSEGFYQMKFMMKSMKQKQDLDEISFLMNDIKSRAENLKNNIDLKLGEVIDSEEARNKILNKDVNLFRVNA